MRKIQFQGQPWIETLEREDQRKQVEVKSPTWGEVANNQKEFKKVKAEFSGWQEISEDEAINKTQQKGIKFEPNSWEQGKNNEDISKAENLVKVQPQTWDAISGLQSPNSIRSFEGVNTLSPFAIKDSHATRNKNVTTKNFPALTVRGGFSMFKLLVASREIDGIAVYQGNELHVICNGVWNVYKNSVWSTVKTGLAVGKKWSFINFKGSFSTMHLIATNGTDPTLKYDGTTVANLANAPATPLDIATHDNRVYLAAKSTIHYSALRKAEDWNTVDESGQIVVETTDGKDITGIVAGSARLTVFKENSIHELFGTNPGNFTMKTITENLGSPTGFSAQVINGVIYFLGNDGVYRYSGGSLPDKEFSIAIQEYIKKIDLGRANKSISWTDGQRYYLGICIGATIPNTILEFDTLYNTWNVWDFTSKMTCNAVMWDGYLYGGNEAGQVTKFDSSTDNAVAVPYEWVSKPFGFSSLAAKSRWFKIWVVADVPVGSTMNIHLSNKEDGESWTLVKAVPTNADAQAQEIQIPTNLVNFSNFIRLRIEGTGPVTIYEVSRQERVFPMGLS